MGEFGNKLAENAKAFGSTVWNGVKGGAEKLIDKGKETLQENPMVRAGLGLAMSAFLNHFFPEQESKQEKTVESTRDIKNFGYGD